MEYNFLDIEKIWQKFWKDNKTFAVKENTNKQKYYVLDMFPYPSGSGLHVGHPLGYIASDIISRYKRNKGFNVLHPMGFDSFGLPAEQYAVKTGQHPKKTTEKNIKERSFEIMKDLNIDHMANSYARELSGGQKKLLELGRSIINDPDILLLDEPLAGVNPKLAEEILQIILNLSEKGISILMVEHNIEAVMKISQRVIVLAEGMVIADDTPENVRNDEKVIEAYLGSENE